MEEDIKIVKWSVLVQFTLRFTLYWVLLRNGVNNFQHFAMYPRVGSIVKINMEEYFLLQIDGKSYVLHQWN